MRAYRRVPVSMARHLARNMVRSKAIVLIENDVATVLPNRALFMLEYSTGRLTNHSSPMTLCQNGSCGMFTVAKTEARTRPSFTMNQYILARSICIALAVLRAALIENIVYSA